MHFQVESAPDADRTALALAAVKEATRSICHLAGVVGRIPAPIDRQGHAGACAQAALEAGLVASRALFTLEDALQRPTQEPAASMGEALAALHAAESALHAARAALEARASRTLRPGLPAGAWAQHG